MTPAEAVDRCQIIFAHAWMVRTFVKHSDEVENFPELMNVVRAVFDTSRALEVKLSEPMEYIVMLRKKVGKLKAAADQFRAEVPQISDHTNFRQAVISLDGCVAELDGILKIFPPPAPPKMPANFRPGSSSSNVSTSSAVDTSDQV